MQQYVIYSTLLGILLAITSTAGVNANLTAINAVIDLLSIGPVFTFETLQNVLQFFDHVLFDIPLDEAAQPLQMTLHKNLQIDDLSDPEAIRLTRFSHAQLRELYIHFGIAGLLDPGEDKLRIPTGWFVGNTPCQYRVDPEEAFLFMMIKVAPGMSNQFIVDNYIGGDYARWSKAYPWMVRYLSSRYEGILGYGGLARFVDQFPHFHNAIERYMRTEKAQEQVDGTFHLIPGLRYCPWYIFAFIDCSIDRISVPFSGPRGDYEGAARRPEYSDAQQAFYTGYCKYHGFKIESILTPDGLSHIFGPVSARPNDVAVLRMSNLNEFLFLLQRGLWITADGAEVLFTAFGDGAYNLGLACISSYYRAFGAVPLTNEQDECNRHLRSARITWNGKQSFSHLQLEGME